MSDSSGIPEFTSPGERGTRGLGLRRSSRYFWIPSSSSSAPFTLHPCELSLKPRVGVYPPFLAPSVHNFQQACLPQEKRERLVAWKKLEALRMFLGNLGPTEGRVRGAAGGRAGALLPLDTMVPSTQPGHERKRGGGHWWRCQGRVIFYVLNKNPKKKKSKTHDVIFAAMTQTWGAGQGLGDRGSH